MNERMLGFRAFVLSVRGEALEWISWRRRESDGMRVLIVQSCFHVCFLP